MPEYIRAFSYNREGRWEHSFLSNGYIEPDGTFIEREYQAAKTHDPQWQARILACEHPFGPNGSKRLGRAAPIRGDWDEVKFMIMAALITKKFRDHPGLAEALRGTRPRILVEGNTWHDNVWGDCHCGNKPECVPQGKNWLGLILMTVRAGL